MSQAIRTSSSSVKIYLWLQFFLTLSSLTLLLVAFYFQYVQGLEPCLLCIMQRICLGFILGLGLMACFYSKRVQRIKQAVVIIYLEFFFILAGLYFALRQVWLQSLSPENMQACLPGFDTLLHYFPWQELLKMLFLGTAECGKVIWTWLGLSMAAWSGLYFFTCLLALIFSLYMLKQRESNAQNE